MPIDPSQLGRRQFFAAAGLSTYSLLYLADDAQRVAADDLSADGIRGSIARSVPTDPEATRRRLEGEPHMTLVDLSCDVLVAGGGPAGICAALAAAREGARVVLVQDRSRLGGNSSSEVKMHMVGANMHGQRPGWREGGIVEELRLDDAVGNPQRCWELWDLLLYDKIVSEPNCRLLLDTAVTAADVENGRIQRALARCDKTEHLYRIAADVFVDCTGDGRLALESGASFRWGREARSELGESLAPQESSPTTLGSSILFTAREHDRPMPYTPPKWARSIEPRQLKLRSIGTWEYGYWWIEWGGQMNTIRDNERIRFELLSIVTGIWDYIKNSGKFPDAQNWALDWVGMVPGKRESRRFVGDHILTQQDVMGENGEPDDAVAIGGWAIDDHPSGGFDDSDKRPFSSTHFPQVYNIPLRCLYSKDVANLMFAGRNISCSHLAFASSRVMATCAVMGQAAGTAAAICCHDRITPREIDEDTPRLQRLQQTLLRNDQTIKGLKNEDPADLARSAAAEASSELRGGRADRVLDGFVRNEPGGAGHRWVAPMEPGTTWLQLTWPTPQTIGHVQITFDSGFERELTLSGSDRVTKKTIRAPQPETIRDYRVLVCPADGKWQEVANVTGNHQRLRRHAFEPIALLSVRIDVLATNGIDEARIFEVRCYA